LAGIKLIATAAMFIYAFTPREQIIREIFDLDDHMVEQISRYIKTLRALQLSKAF
jgi:hypothetical protein